MRALFLSELVRVDRVSCKTFKNLCNIRFSPSLTLIAFRLLTEISGLVKSTSSSYTDRRRISRSEVFLIMKWRASRVVGYSASRRWSNDKAAVALGKSIDDFGGLFLDFVFSHSSVDMRSNLRMEMSSSGSSGSEASITKTLNEHQTVI